MAPIITGTDKQIDWALTIRSKVLAFIAAEVEKSKPFPGYAEVEARYASTLAALDKKTDATWWIDNRDIIASRLANKIVG